MRIAALFFLFCLSVISGSEKTIALFVRVDFSGEYSLAQRIQTACKHIGWRAEIIDIEKKKEFKQKRYDFAINLVPGAHKHASCKNYLAIFHPIHHDFNKNGFLTRKYRSYDGYLLTYFPKKKRFVNRKYPYMIWYPTVQEQEYREVDPSSLFHICCCWGNRFESEKFRKFLSLLDKESYTRFYGNSKFQEIYPQSYRERIAYDDESLCEVAARAGVSLVLHSSDHNRYGIPSGRIFEAAAASTVIISDKNKFVEKNFSDSVLYIDTDQDAVSIFNQIQSHMSWIRKNKPEALEKAKKAHTIFEEKFLLEDQLLALEKFHDRLSSRPRGIFWALLETLGYSKSP